MAKMHILEFVSGQTNGQVRERESTSFPATGALETKSPLGQHLGKVRIIQDTKIGQGQETQKAEFTKCSQNAEQHP